MNRTGTFVLLMLAAIGLSIGMDTSCTAPGTSPESPSGACCLEDGSCQDSDSDACDALDGTFNEGQTCDQVECPTSGACCLDDGTCEDSDSAACDAINGTFNEGQTCEQVECPKSGACCLEDGSCLDSDSSACDDMNGTFTEGQTCEQVECPKPGACCLEDGTCVDSDSAECDAINGTFNEGQSCADVVCPQPAPLTGACCLENGTCLELEPGDCAVVEGTYNQGLTCDEVVCEQPAAPLGACCLVDGSCMTLDSDECSTLTGSFTEGESCSQFQCPAPSLTDVVTLAEGIELVARDGVASYIQTVSIVGREYWNLNGDDPSQTGELLGKEGAALNPDGALNTDPFVAQYALVRQTLQVINATENTDAALTDQQKNGLKGYAKTWQAYALLLALNLQFSNGIIPADELDNPDPEGEFLSYANSLAHIADLLDEGATFLTNGGSAFAFNLSSGLTGFTTPATFRQFNRALSARVRIYQGDKPGSISGIAGSFFNINGSMNTGPAHGFSLETRNPLYYQPDVDLFTVHPDFLADADAGDLRVSNKTRAYVATPQFTVPVSFDGLTGDTQVSTIAMNTDPFPIIRNEELILIYAEAQIGSDVNESLAAINRVRNAAGLGNYLGATDDASMLNEVLKQRRYSFFGEGHRWIDLRRTGKFGQINIDRVGDVVHMEFPRPSQPTLLGL